MKSKHNNILLAFEGKANKTQGVCDTMALPFTLLKKKDLNSKQEELLKLLKYNFTMQKIIPNLQKVL
jgi:hypothetical protein